MTLKLKPEEYFKDLSKELHAVQDRVRQLLGKKHWPTDGAWKESVLRSMIRGYLPPSMSVGSGFILTNTGLSTQIDILIYDDSAPVHFRDGDTVIIPPDAVRAVIEVKTRVQTAQLQPAIKKLAKIARKLAAHQRSTESFSEQFRMNSRTELQQPFIGLFCYSDVTCPASNVLRILREENGFRIGIPDDFPISAMCFGNKSYFRYWKYSPIARTRRQEYYHWHAYEMPERAPGYFIHNVIESLYPKVVERSPEVWYPADGKESRRIGAESRMPITHRPQTSALLPDASRGPASSSTTSA